MKIELFLIIVFDEFKNILIKKYLTMLLNSNL